MTTRVSVIEKVARTCDPAHSAQVTRQIGITAFSCSPRTLPGGAYALDAKRA